MSGIDKSTLKFLHELARHNDRDWFATNKPRYEDAKADFEKFLQALITRIAKFDPTVADQEARKCAFRIYRDTRFSKDKSPYRPRMGGHILEGGRKYKHTRSGYYLHIAPGNCFLASGTHLPPGPWISAIRARIDKDPATFRKILAAKSFKSNFGEMEGECLKTAPKGYAKDHKDIDLLRHKSFLAVHRLKDVEISKKDFLAQAARIYKAAMPFSQYLNEAAA